VELKWTELHLTPEGNRPSQEEYDPWVEIASAAQSGMVMRNTVLGVEVVEFDGKRMPVWVLSFDGIKGIVPLPETGLKVTEPGNGTSERRAFEANLRRMQRYVGRPIHFVVRHIDRETNLVLLSRKQAEEIKRDLTWPKLAVGQVVEAAVKEFGFTGANSNRRAGVAYLDISGVRGILPAAEVSWSWVEDLREEFSLDEVIKVKILELDPAKKEARVSRKALLPDPWEKVSELIRVGGVYAGKVTRVATGADKEGRPRVYCFVRLPNGLDLTAPMPPFGRVEKGSRVNVKVVGIDPQHRRMWGRILPGGR
jgi:ribosomal protein S1